ncbi:MAG: T9SS type A sorting domain-containing protein, partial [Ignavibacteriaceae bacterium]
ASIYDYSVSNLTSDYNDLYYEPNQYNALVRIGSTNYNTLTDWQATGKDLNSIAEMPNFVDPYLHIDETIPTYLESGATPIAGIDTDYDGDPRSVTTPDIGADEFDGTVVGIEEETALPTEFALEQNFPNPFNPSTKIKYSIPTQSKVVIKVYDLLGNEIAVLMDEEKSIGTYELTWNAPNLPSGIYFYRLQAGTFVQTRKMILLK